MGKRTAGRIASRGASSGTSAEVLANRLSALASYREVDRESVTRLGRLIRAVGDAELARVNPFAFGATHRLHQASVVDLFVHATRVGLFDLQWNTVCVWCGAVEWVHDTLNTLERQKFRCTMCHSDMNANLDERTEVTFSVNSAVRRLRRDPWASLDDYLDHYHSPSFPPSAAFRDYLERSLRGHALNPPDAAATIQFQARPGEIYRLFSLDLHTSALIRTSRVDERARSRIEVDASPGGFLPRRQVVAPGAATLVIRNRRTEPTGAVLILWRTKEYHDLVAAAPPARNPYLTGKMLLNTQSFRQLFRVHELDDDLRLNIKSLTLLFTDLKGSTALYERRGDVAAYATVRRHFRLLGTVIAAHRGAIIKTMGDSVMAAFSTEGDGVAAAIEIDRAFTALNRRSASRGEALALRIGLHEGPALAVNAEQRLDYFGRTVNVAARVQAATPAGEISITESLFHRADVRALTRGEYSVRRQTIKLKGIPAPVVVYGLRGRPSASKIV